MTALKMGELFAGPGAVVMITHLHLLAQLAATREADQRRSLADLLRGVR